MQVSYQYKLRPNDIQSKRMDEWINMLRNLYNWMLADRIDGYYQTFVMGDYCDIRTKAEISPLTCSLRNLAPGMEIFILMSFRC